MSIADWKNCVKFERFIRKVYSRDIWAEDICFYLDGKSFICKSNLNDQTRAPKTEEWRKTGEGLKPDYVAKVNKVSSGGKVAHFMVAASVLICEQFKKRNGAYFAGFIRRNSK